MDKLTEKLLRDNPFTEYGTGLEQTFVWFDGGQDDDPFVFFDPDGTEAFRTFEELLARIKEAEQYEEEKNQ